ncbi:hypothetical protein EDD17DRAFT_1565478 [Pisolithus thermaeus]|nr:hypothetical protein EV401DRAFT_1976240 [Pisolithus croceorrhizus]KAI6164075.1 hypothetical protein EDD17DRAFT_1565478 [Pisolithus thermaeus]
MSNVRINLQPPPNVDFVVGYPGIPPGARDRPQAAVKGAVEVRVGAQGAKAKWVRVELKKIETLPGGGQANSYYDHIGSSPIVLWQSSEEYSMLHSQDFPFLIRIPESIPPSIALERGAGIRYELVATACTLGKRGFFRRRKTTVVSQAATIIIDKHELHSTWPVYSQPESRSTFQEGVRLTVERGRTCYGPGDRVSITAILRSEMAQPVMLRGFEFTLRETTVFRAGPHASGAGGSGANKRTGPQVRVATIGEQKVPLTASLHHESQHKAELGCLIPNTHTTTSLNAARHIDITYNIIVRAWVGSSQSVTMELPVIVSNWPRNVSEEAIRRIGLAPSLCMTSPSSTAPTVPITSATPHHNVDHTFSSASTRGATGHSSLIPPRQHVQYSSAPIGHNGIVRRDAQLEADEMGGLIYGRRGSNTSTVDHPGFGASSSAGQGFQQSGMARIEEDVANLTAGGVDITARPSLTGSIRTPRHGRQPSATGSQAGHQQNRLTITNYSEREVEAIAAENSSSGGISGSDGGRPGLRPSSGPCSQWPTAEDEKTQLYESAVARVQKVQGAAAMANGAMQNDSLQPASTNVTPKKSITPWPTAEEEKIRLYDQAQAIAKRTQALGTYSPSLHSRTSSEANGLPRANSPTRGGSGGVRAAAASPSVTMSAGAALYQSGLSSMNSKPSNSNLNNSRTSPEPQQTATVSNSRNVPRYPTAEEEKAALKRYHEAKLAVDRNQNTQYASREGIITPAPVSYDMLYPPGASSSSSGPAAGSSNVGPVADMPPPFEASGSQQQAYLTEKERMRRHYEALDAAPPASPPAPPGQGTSDQGSSPAYTAPAPSYPSVESELSEKEILRRQYAGQDAAAFSQQQSSLPVYQLPPSPPVRINGTRAHPIPPMVNGKRPLTAAEEKAQLKAKYEAEARESNNGGSAHGHGLSTNSLTSTSHHPYANGSASQGSPPPLMPRPPAQYIQETQEEDLRGRYHDNIGVDEPLQGIPPMRTISPTRNPPLEVRPFSPFDSGFGYDATNSPRSPPPPPQH